MSPCGARGLSSSESRSFALRNRRLRLVCGFSLLSSRIPPAKRPPRFSQAGARKTRGRDVVPIGSRCGFPGQENPAEVLSSRGTQDTWPRRRSYRLAVWTPRPGEPRRGSLTPGHARHVAETSFLSVRGVDSPAKRTPPRFSQAGARKTRGRDVVPIASRCGFPGQGPARTPHGILRAASGGRGRCLLPVRASIRAARPARPRREDRTPRRRRS